MQASKPALEDYLVLILLSAIWGASFLFLRVSSPVFGPFFLIEMRVASGLLVLLPLCIAMKKHHEIIANWRSLFVLSLCNMTLPFCLLAYATLSIGAGFASILNATVPFFTAILAFTFWQQKLSLTAVLGMLLGFVGVVLLMLSYSGPIAANAPLKAIAAGLLGGSALRPCYQSNGRTPVQGKWCGDYHRQFTILFHHSTAVCLLADA